MTRSTVAPVQRLTAAAILLFALAAFVGAFGYVHYRKASALDSLGVHTSADVVQVTQRSKAGMTTGYYLDVVFEANGEPAHSTLLVSNELGQRIWNESETRPVRIVYLPDDPTFAVLADPNERAIGHGDAIERYTGFLLAVPMALFGCFVLFMRRRHVRQGSDIKPE